MSDKNLTDQVMELLRVVMKNEFLMDAVDKALGNQPLMDIVGSIYKAGLVKKVLEIVFQLVVPSIEKYMPPESLRGIFEQLALSENDEVMEKIAYLLVIAFTNLAPSERLV